RAILAPVPQQPPTPFDAGGACRGRQRHANRGAAVIFSRRRMESLLLLVARQALTVLGHWIWEKNDYLGVSALPVRGWIWKANGQLLCLAYTGRLGADVQLVRQALGLEPAELTLHDAKRFGRAGQIQTGS